MEEIPFGDKVVISKIYKRKSRKQNNKFFKIWEEIQLNKEGIFLGWRTIADGEIWHDGYNNYFTPNNYKKAALVCFSPNCNPVYVPEDSINKLKGLKR
jgi:hypothetical protein